MIDRSSPGTVRLFRPVGPRELALIRESGFAAFPARLEGQPFFYPVLTFAYAEQIARDWNVRDSGYGAVTEFDVDATFLANYEVHEVGGRAHREYWIPAVDLPALNRAIVNGIRIVAEYSLST